MSKVLFDVSDRKVVAVHVPCLSLDDLGTEHDTTSVKLSEWPSIIYSSSAFHQVEKNTDVELDMAPVMKEEEGLCRTI